MICYNLILIDLDLTGDDMKKTVFAIALGAIIAAPIVYANSSTTSVSSVATQTQTTGLNKAIDTANARIKGNVISAKYDRGDNEYEVKIITQNMKHEVELNGQHKLIKAKKKRIERDDTSEYVAYRNVAISLERAMQIASDSTGMNVIEIELDTKNGLLVYEIEVGQGFDKYDVVIDANSGNVIRNDVR